MVIDPAKRYTATMVTSHGTMVIALDPLAAPKTVNSFVFLARYHYYDGIIFHRIIPGFVLQGGDPTGTGTGGPGYRFADELPGAGPLPDRLAGHGQRRPQHQRQPVLRHQRARRRRACRRSTRSSAPWSAAATWSTAIDALGTRSGKPTETVVIESVTIAEED